MIIRLPKPVAAVVPPAALSQAQVVGGPAATPQVDMSVPVPPVAVAPLVAAERKFVPYETRINIQFLTRDEIVTAMGGTFVG